MLTSILSISLGAILINNFIMSQFLGCCPFFGVSKKIERLTASADCPKCFEGFPIALISASLMAMAFLGFSGMKIW